MRHVLWTAARWALLAVLVAGSGSARAERSPRAERRHALASVQPRAGLSAAGERDAGRDDPGDSPSEPGEEAAHSLEHRVAAGETLSGIARRYGTTVERLLEANPGLTADHVREGQRIAIDRDRTRVRYVVSPGDTLTRIAELHGLTVADIRRYNPELDPDRIRTGQTLTLYPAKPASTSESIGSPARGLLVAARRLPPGPGYVIRAPERAFGTDETVRGVVAAFAKLRQLHPDAPRLSVHDLSLRRGGRMDDHRSHQSGRDVDIAYPQRSCERGLCRFTRIAPDELDAEVAWTLLHYWLSHDLLEAVFIDYRLQAPLYRAARARGATPAQLSRWFQYPRGRGHPLGIVRHHPKHADHMHVRFACHASDPECRSYRPLLMHAAR